MAAHTTLPPTGAEPFVRGDPATWVVRFKDRGVDQDITAWTWRCYIRDRIDGNKIGECTDFDVTTPQALGDLFPGDNSVVPCVLLLSWVDDDTALWQTGYVSDIEQLTPAKRTWLIIDSIKVDKDVSSEPGVP